MPQICGVKIVNKTGIPAQTDIFDLETGEKIVNVTEVSMKLTRLELDVSLHVRMPFEYEGPARVILESEQDDGGKC